MPLQLMYKCALLLCMIVQHIKSYNKLCKAMKMTSIPLAMAFQNSREFSSINSYNEILENMRQTIVHSQAYFHDEYLVTLHSSYVLEFY